MIINYTIRTKRCATITINYPLLTSANSIYYNTNTLISIIAILRIQKLLLDLR